MGVGLPPVFHSVSSLFHPHSSGIKKKSLSPIIWDDSHGILIINGPYRCAFLFFFEVVCLVQERLVVAVTADCRAPPVPPPNKTPYHNWDHFFHCYSC